MKQALGLAVHDVVGDQAALVAALAYIERLHGFVLSRMLSSRCVHERKRWPVISARDLNQHSTSPSQTGIGWTKFPTTGSDEDRYRMLNAGRGRNLNDSASQA